MGISNRPYECAKTLKTWPFWVTVNPSSLRIAGGKYGYEGSNSF
jgi:hypothetical protein